MGFGSLLRSVARRTVAGEARWSKPAFTVEDERPHGRACRSPPPTLFPYRTRLAYQTLSKTKMELGRGGGSIWDCNSRAFLRLATGGSVAMYRLEVERTRLGKNSSVPLRVSSSGAVATQRFPTSIEPHSPSTLPHTTRQPPHERVPSRPSQNTRETAFSPTSSLSKHRSFLSLCWGAVRSWHLRGPAVTAKSGL